MGSAVLGLQTLAQVAMEREYLAQEFASSALEEGEIADERYSDAQEAGVDADAMVIARTSTTDSMETTNSQILSSNTLLSPANNTNITNNNSGNNSNSSSEKHTSASITSYFNAEKRKVFVVGETEFCTNIQQGDDHYPPPAYDQLMIATKKTKFRVGERLPASRSFSTNGKIIFLLNQEKKVEKMEILFSAKMASQSSRYLRGNIGNEN